MCVCVRIVYYITVLVCCALRGSAVCCLLLPLTDGHSKAARERYYQRSCPVGPATVKCPDQGLREPSHHTAGPRERGLVVEDSRRGMLRDIMLRNNVILV